MTKTHAGFHVGDLVKVKQGVCVPDYKTLCIEGWQGRVAQCSDIDPSDVFIEWDSVTLRDMPREYIEDCERDGYGYQNMTLSADDVENARSRDTAADVAEAQCEIEKTVSWIAFGEEGQRIRLVLEGIDEDDELATFAAWETHLRRVLSFPFNARVAESEDGWLLRHGDSLSVTGIAEVVEEYGVIVDVDRDGKHLQFPLCNLKTSDPKSKNWQPVSDHAVWFANR